MCDGRDAPMIRLRVRELRDARGWTQDELAARSGVARITIARIEAQRTAGIDFAVWERLALAFGMHPVELVDFRPGEPQTSVARKTGRPLKAPRRPKAAPDAKRRAAKRRRRRD
jgi:transcriptional regulator with XRE-family HTH domain